MLGEFFRRAVKEEDRTASAELQICDAHCLVCSNFIIKCTKGMGYFFSSFLSSWIVHTPTTILIHLDILENGTNKVGSCCMSQGSAQDSQCDGNQTHVTEIKAGLQESVHLCLE